MLAKHIKDQGSMHQLAKQLDRFHLPSHCPVNNYHQIPSQRCLHIRPSIHTEFGTRASFLIQKQVTRGVLSISRNLQAEGNDTCNILPALHAFTGYNKTSAFLRKGKTILIYLYHWYPWCFLSLRRSSDMPHHTWSISCACYIIGIQPLRYKRFASCRVCRKIHPKTRKGTFNLQ